MKKILNVALVLAGAFLFALFPQRAFAQFTTVTATVQDPNGIPYAGAVMNAVLVPGSSGGYTLSGSPYSGRIGPVTLDSTGSFTVNFGDVTRITPGSPQWQITIDSAAATIGLPLGTGPQSFVLTSTGTTISGGSPVSLTTALNALAPKLTNFASGGSGTISCSISAAVLFETAANTAGCASTLTYINASERLQVGDPFSGLSASTLFPVTGQPYNVQSITHSSSTAPSFVSVVGVAESNGAVDSSSNHIGGGFFVANATAELDSTTGTAPITGVQATGISSHSTGNEGQTLGGLFTGENTNAGTATDVAGLAAQSVVSGSGLVTAASGIHIYTPTVTGGTPPTNEYGVNIDAISGGVANNGINISNQAQNATTWAIHTGTGKNELGDNLIVHGPISVGSSPPTACGSATGCIALTEASTAGTPTAGQEYFRADSTTHSTTCSMNNSADGACTFNAVNSVNAIAALTNGVNMGVVSLTGNTTVPVGFPFANSWGFLPPASASFTSWFIQPVSVTAPTAGCITRLGAPASSISAMSCDANLSLIGGQIILPAGTAAAPTVALPSPNSGYGFGVQSAGNFYVSSAGVFTMFFDRTVPKIQLYNVGLYCWDNSATDASGSCDTGFSRDAAGIIDVGTGAQGNKGGTLQSGKYNTGTNCSSSAAPAVCGSAAAGSVVVAAAATTVTVNTTAVTANSQIFLAADDTLGTKLSVTCNSTLATLIGGLAITARTAGTSFQITSGATPAVNPLCISYFIVN